MAVAASTAAGCSRVKWLTDLEKTVIVSNFEKRGWVKGSLEGWVRGYRVAASRIGEASRL